MEVRYYLWSNMTAPETISFPGGKVCVFSTPRPDGVGRNEDGALLATLLDGRTVLAVADGAGGHRESDRAASWALRALGRELERASVDGDRLRDVILDGFEKANRVLRRRGSGVGTTLAVAQLAAGRARTWHVGDTQLLVVGQRGKLKMTSVPHSPTGYLVEAGWMDPADALAHEDRHLISNLVGTEDMHVEVRPEVPLAPRDTLLLASDGLFDNVSVEEVVETVRKGDPERAVARLAALCRGRMLDTAGSAPSHSDDLTILAYRPRTGSQAQASRGKEWSG